MYLVMGSISRRPVAAMKTAKCCAALAMPASVEIIESGAGSTYRAVYTVRFEAAVFVLHVFQKKSKTGVATPKPDMELIETRLKRAAEIAEEMKRDSPKKP